MKNFLVHFLGERIVRAHGRWVRSEYLELRKAGVRRREEGSRAFSAGKDL